MDISKYRGLFLQEAGEHVSGIEKSLLGLEKGGPDPHAVENLFRHYHSIKGMAASMGYDGISRLAHAQEDLLDRARSKKLELSGAMLAALLRCADALKGLLKMVEEDRPPAVDVNPFIDEIRALVEGRPALRGADAGAAELRLPQTMKVDVRVFDGLLAAAGDLFMALSPLKTLSQGFRSIAFKDSVHMLGKSINAIYDNILSARMLPIRDLTEGLPRVVRDVSNETGKRVALRVVGAEVSVDRSILEGLAAPLVHMIRNSVDHGIEPPEERVRAGKTSEGSVEIRAYNKKDRVIVEVSDDGAGIDREKVKARAIAMGMPAGRISAMTDEETLQLVCAPGLSVKEKATGVSGRGVGMDVVKTSVEAFGGSLRVESWEGRGTRMTLELPRTASIVKALLVSAGGEQFLMPSSMIEKVLDAEGKDLDGAFRHGGRDIPLISLAGSLGMDSGGHEARAIVIAGDGEALAGIKIDGFIDEIDAYVKPLTPPISRLWGVSGITVMADGRTVFLLDLRQIVSRAIKEKGAPA